MAVPTMLHSNLSALADLAAKESAKFATNGVKLEVHPGGGYSACATDGKVLGVVTGRAGDGDDFPSLPALESAPNGAVSAIVPAKDWKDAMKAPTKFGRRTRDARPIFSQVAVVPGEKVTTFAATDLDKAAVAQPRNLEGRFPPYVHIIPTAPPAFVVTFNPHVLAQMLKVAAAFCEPGTECVTLEFQPAGVGGSEGPANYKPVVVKAAGPGQEFTGLVMPLAG